jgi:hypothetical protein
LKAALSINKPAPAYFTAIKISNIMSGCIGSVGGGRLIYLHELASSIFGKTCPYNIKKYIQAWGGQVDLSA